MDFALTESQELIKKEVGALARTFSLDYWLDKDDRAEYPSDFVKAFADNGWLGITIPEEYGGAGLGVTEAALMLHEICASGAGTSGCSPVHFYVFPPTPIVKYGTEAMKRQYLPRIVSGDEDELCLEPSLLIKRVVPRAGLAVLPCTGHAVNLEEPLAFNRLLEDFLHQVSEGKWPVRDPRTKPESIWGPAGRPPPPDPR